MLCNVEILSFSELCNAIKAETEYVDQIAAIHGSELQEHCTERAFHMKNII